MGDRTGARVAAFISIPRNCSNSVRTSLGLGPRRLLESTDCPVIDEIHQRGAVTWRRCTIFNRCSCFALCAILTIAASPGHHHHRAAGLEPYWSLPFDGWVRVGLPHHWYRQNETDYHQERISPLLQSNFIDGAKVDFVGRVESFERDLRTVSAMIAARCAEIGIDPPPCSMVAHENRSCRLEGPARLLFAGDLGDRDDPVGARLFRFRLSPVRLVTRRAGPHDLDRQEVHLHPCPEDRRHVGQGVPRLSEARRSAYPG